jgi:hypothetical protein
MKQRKSSPFDIGESINNNLEALSNMASGDIAADMLPIIQELATRVAKTAAAIQDNVKKKVKELVLNKGTKFTDAGSMAYLVNGYRMEIRPSGGGYDETKIKQLIQSKPQKGAERDITTYCDEDIRYVLNWEKVNKLVEKKVVKQSELESCKNAVSYSVQSPTKMEMSDE